MLRYLTAGESHGRSLTAIVEGMPAGVKIDIAAINEKMRRRQGGYGRGGRMAIEKDKVEFTAGLRASMTLGSPLALVIENNDWINWQRIMDPIEEPAMAEKIVTKPRPGHADLSGALKYRHDDIRNILERASARETTVRVAVGAVAQEFLSPFGIKVQGQVVSVGKIRAAVSANIVEDSIYDTPFYCNDPEASGKMKALVDEAKQKGDSIGGIFQVIVEGLPAGLGTHVHWDRRLDGLIAQALMSIPSVKGVEIGDGFQASTMMGSKAHDEISFSEEKRFYRKSNHAGGLEGGLTNGESLIVKAAIKPIPTLLSPLQTVDIIDKEVSLAAVERSDVCVVPAAAIVGEAAVAWALACALSEKFGGDHLDETLDNYSRYLSYLQSR